MTSAAIFCWNSESLSVAKNSSAFSTDSAQTSMIERPGTERAASKMLAARSVPGLSIMDVCALSVEKADEFFATLKLSEFQQKIAAEVIKEIRARLGFLKNVGLGYLTLDRESGSLSGGEAQRIRLATQIGAGLVGVLYILDEPSIGLHQRD